MCWGVITWTDDNFFPLVAHFQPGLMMLFGGASQFATAVHRLPAIQGHLVGGHFNSTARWFVRHRGGGDGENILKIQDQGSEAIYKVRGGKTSPPPFPALFFELYINDKAKDICGNWICPKKYQIFTQKNHLSFWGQGVQKPHNEIHICIYVYIKKLNVAACIF